MSSTSSTRPRRVLIPPPTNNDASFSPRRSNRIKESPGVDYSPAKSRSNGTVRPRSRSKSRVLKDSHGVKDENLLASLPEERLRPPRYSQRGLDFQSDDEDDVTNPIKPVREEDGRLMDVLGGINLAESFSRLKNATLNTSKETLMSISKMKNLRWSDRDKVKAYLSSVNWRKPLFCIGLLVLMVLVYRLNSQSTLDAEPGPLVVMLSCVLAPIRQWAEGARHVYLSIPDLLLPSGTAGGVETHGDVVVDYDLLVTKILDNQRFTSLIERLSSRHKATLESDLASRLATEMETVRTNAASQQQRIFTEVEKEILGLKHQIDGQMKEASSGNVAIEAGLRELKTEQDSLRTRLTDLALANAATDAVQPVDPAAIEQLRLRLEGLETDLPSLRARVTSCCEKPDLGGLVVSQMNSFLAENASLLVDSFSKHFTTKSQHEANLVSIDAELAKLKDAFKNEINQEAERMSQKMESVTARVLEMQAESAGENVNQETDASVVERIVKKALARYDADKTGLFDYALESAGGSILSTRCTENYELSSAVMSVWGVPIWWETNTPRSILQPGTAPGQCWAFRGSTGAVVIKLLARITPRAVTIEHISPLSTPDGQLASAPKDIAVGGLVGDTLVPIANITYDKEGDPVQTFWFDNQQQFDTIELNIRSNYGHPEYTCIYRVRVHGDLSEEEKIH